jgi:predicted secreted hydrolase
MRRSRTRWAAYLLIGVAAALGVGFAAGSMAAAAAPPFYAPVTADQPLVFPADYGSHPKFRTEWWYVTGWLTTARGEPLGFQITLTRIIPVLSHPISC